MTGPEERSSPYPDYPAALRDEVDGLAVEGNELLEAAAGVTTTEFEARLDHLVARAEQLWIRAGWTELERESSARSLQASVRMVAGILRDDR